MINQPESSVVARQMSGVSEMNDAEEKKGRGNEEGRVEEMRRGGERKEKDRKSTRLNSSH